MNFYIADMHLGHKNVLKFDNRPFLSVSEMDKVLIENWNSRVSTNDDVYLLGDVCYRSEHIPAWYLKQLNGRKHLIQGNHDAVLMKDSEAMGCIDSVDKMLFVKDCGERIVLCHFPIAEWNGFHKGAYHIYGHIHNRTDGVYQYMRTLERALNAGCMLNGYQPVTFKELIENNERYKDNLE